MLLNSYIITHYKLLYEINLYMHSFIYDQVLTNNINWLM